MSAIYDNWERLVAATLKREQFRELCRATSISSIASSFASPKRPDLPFEFSSLTSLKQQILIPKTRAYRWGYSIYDREVEADKSPVIKQQLAPGDIFVNGKPLNRNELNLLQSCTYPPKGLKPGRYWYDKYAGFWGKKGHKPSHIISANLDLGGVLEPSSSHGSTLVFINGREITKAELRMLQLVGVKCYPDTHFWMNEDGSYQEEAGVPMSRSIWAKVGVKLICSLLSLPVPPKPSPNSNWIPLSENMVDGDYWKLLLIGCNGSGTGTIFNQALFLYKDVPFFEDELVHIKSLIRSNIYSYISILLEGRKRFEEESLTEPRIILSSSEHDFIELDDSHDGISIYSLTPRLEAISDWILHFKESSGLDFFPESIIQETASLVEELLDDPAFQKTYERRSELQSLSTAANYFLERALVMLKPGYVLSQTDILFARGFLPSLSYTDFSFPPPNDSEDYLWYGEDFTRRCQLIRSTPNGTVNKEGRLFEMFGDTRIVIYCICISDYDQFTIDEDGATINKMIYAKECFESMTADPMFNHIQFLLLLTKYDLFEEKIVQSPLNRCEWFADFAPVEDYRGTIPGILAQKGFHYIAIKFKRLYEDLTGKILYVAPVKCLERESTGKAFQYASEIIMWEEYRSEWRAYSDYSDYSLEFDSD